MKYLWIITVVFMTSAGITFAGVEVYKWTDASGNVIYSDTPHLDAEVVEVDITPSYTPPVIADYPEAAEIEEDQAYKISILSPQAGEALWSNGGVSVEIELEPALNTKVGQKLIVQVDGQIIGEPQTTNSFVLDITDRGTHTISVSLQSNVGTTLATSQPVNFQLHRQSVNNN